MDFIQFVRNAVIRKEVDKMAKYCEKCGRLCDDFEYYYSHRLDKYPDGRLNICKKCVIQDVDIFNPDTFLWILKEIDVPYMQDIWNSYVDHSIEKDYHPMQVLGKYLARMKLCSLKAYRWEDTSVLARHLALSRIRANIARREEL